MAASVTSVTYVGYVVTSITRPDDQVGLFTGTVWRLSAVAIFACLIGRLHIFLASHLTNRTREANSDPPPISFGYQTIMWLSGLRGGVAFAIAAVSWK